MHQAVRLFATFEVRNRGENMHTCPEADDVYRRLVAGDPTAPAQFAELFLDPLFQRLQARYPSVEPELVIDAVTDTIMAFIKRPSIYSPERGSIEAYLFMSARGDLLNSLARKKRRYEREISVEDVEQVVPRGNIETEEWGQGSASGDLVPDDVLAVLDDPVDREVLRLMIQGERRTEAYSEVLQIGDRSALEQRRIVKRHKDRIKKRLQRSLRGRTERRGSS